MPRSRLANLAVAAAIGALFLVGLFTHGVVAAVVLLVVAALLALLTSQAWPAIPGRGRGVRVIVFALVVVVAIVKLVSD